MSRGRFPANLKSTRILLDWFIWSFLKKTQAFFLDLSTGKNGLKVLKRKEILNYHTDSEVVFLLRNHLVKVIWAETVQYFFLALARCLLGGVPESESGPGSQEWKEAWDSASSSATLVEQPRPLALSAQLGLQPPVPSSATKPRPPDLS